jgi:hypothetical protein
MRDVNAHRRDGSVRIEAGSVRIEAGVGKNRSKGTVSSHFSAMRQAMVLG